MKLPWIDTHVHVWDQNRVAYPWMTNTAATSTVASIPSPEQLSAAAVSGVILVEAGAQDFEAEVRYLRVEATNPAVLGIVVGCDWRRPQTLAGLLADRSSLAGVRVNLLNAKSSTASDAKLLAVVLQRARDAGLTVDVLTEGGGLELLRAALESSQHGQVVIDHMGRPPISAGIESPEGRAWLVAISALAAIPAVNLKLSGVPSLAQRTADALPFWSAAVSEFSPRSLLLGSDWPMAAAKGRHGYGDWVSTMSDALPVAFDVRLRLSNARRIYGLL